MRSLHEGCEIRGAEQALTAIRLIVRALALFVILATRLIVKTILSVCAVVIGFVIGFLLVTRLRR